MQPNEIDLVVPVCEAEANEEKILHVDFNNVFVCFPHAPGGTRATSTTKNTKNEKKKQIEESSYFDFRQLIDFVLIRNHSELVAGLLV